MKYSQALFSIFLSALIVFTGSPFQLYYQAQAQSSSGGASEPSPEFEHQQSIEELRRAFIDPSQGEAKLDPFLLTRQRVTDDRQKNLDAINAEERLKDYLERVSYFEGQVAELSELSKKVANKISQVSSADKNRLTELVLIKDDIESRRKIIELELLDVKKFDPRLGEALPVDFMVDPELRRKHYWGRRMRVRIGGMDAPQGEVKQQSFTESLSPKFSADNPVQSAGDSSRTGFIITDHKGHPLNEFFKPVEALFFFGQYLVYVEKEALSKQGKTLPVRFIDTRYFKANIGNAPLPVFTLPLNVSEMPSEFKIENGRLIIGDVKLSHQQFEMLSKTQQLIFNVNVALVDPSSFKNARPLISEIVEFFGKSMKGQDKLFKSQLEKAVSADPFLKNITGNLSDRTLTPLQLEAQQIELQEEDPRKGREKARAFIEQALKDGKVKSSELDKILRALDANWSLTDSNNATRVGRQLFTRIRLLMRFLIEPRPEGAPKLFNSLIIAVTGGKDAKERLRDFNKNNLLGKLTKYGMATGGVVLAASVLPEPYTLNVQKSLDLVSAVSQHFQGYLQHINYGKAYAELSTDAFVTSTTGWTYFIQSYFADGKWSKFLYGIGNVLLIPLQLFATIHLVVNSVKMAAKGIQMRSLSKGQLGFIKAFKKAALEDNRSYWDSLAEAEKKASGQDLSVEDPAEQKLLEEHLQRLRQGREGLAAVQRDIRKGKYGTRTSLRAFVSTLAGYTQKMKVGQSLSGKMNQVSSKLSMGGKETFRRALANTFLSYSSLRSTFKFNAIVWNYLFVTRSFIWSPSKWLMMLIFPNYFTVALTKTEGKQHFPSQYNRGLEYWPAKIHRLISRAGQFAKLDKVPVVKNLMISRQGLEALKSFEMAVLPIEDIAKEVALKKAQVALIENIDNPDRILNIFESSQGKAGTTTGIKSLHDSKISKLSVKERIFYRAYFTRTFDVLMQKFIAELSSTSLGEGVTPEQFAKKLRSELRNGNSIDLEVSGKDLQRVEAKIEAEIDFDKIRNWANQVGNNARSFANKLDLQFRHKLLKSIHPQNPQLARFLLAREKVNEPRAMERAMRMEVSSLFSSIPLGIISTLALYAGVQTGAIQPFDPEGMNTETHFRYMSRYLFYSGFIPGLIVGLMANTWGKVQEDSRIDALGGFDKAIKHSDGVRGFWRFYLKNAFKNPVNKWAANHVFMLKLIWANVPAAAVTIVAANLYGLGRIDVGAFLGGYIMVYATFLTGFSMKMEQAFELASKWVTNRIPRKLRAHKEAQKYISGSLQKRKLLFSYFETAWGIIVDENIAGTMLVLKDNVKYGTRAFLRVVFGGFTPTEIIVNMADQLSRTFEKIPGMEKGTEMVKRLFSNNFEAFERFPKDLPKPPEGVERVMENPNLPKNALGEVIGKAGAMVTTIGGVAAVPYIVTDAFNNMKQKAIQKRGRKLRCSTLFAPQ